MTPGVVEQGLSFTVVEAPHPLDGEPAEYDARRDFHSARRVWLGSVPGVDWLHESIESEFGEDQVWYEVESKRDATHVGAAGEIATVVLILMGASAIEFGRKFVGRLGEASADSLLDWIRDRARKRREEKGWQDADPPPDFHERDLESLSEGMRGELADLLGVPERRLELMSAERQPSLAMAAVYRDAESGREYVVSVDRDSATFKWIGAPELPKPPAARRRRLRLPWQRG